VGSLQPITVTYSPLCAALILITNILEGLALFVPTHLTYQFARQINIIQGTSFCTTAATSLLATFIIGAEIHRSTTFNTVARRRYRYIMEITIQSSTMYTLAIVGNAVLVLINNSDLDLTGSTLLNAGSYFQVLLIVTTVSYSLNLALRSCRLFHLTLLFLGVFAYLNGCAS